MARNSTGNNKFLKEYNQAGILDLIRIHKSISRAELARITGLSPTAIGVITLSLLEKGYIHEMGTGESKGGRRPVLLELKPRSFYSVGVDFDVNYTSIALIDITGDVIYEETMDMPVDEDFTQVMSRMKTSINRILETLSIDREKLLGIGMSVPGIVDDERCEIKLAPNLGWSDINVREHLGDFPDVPVYAENEARASAICESWIGCCHDIDDFVCINIRSGIGAGMFIGGRLHRGVCGSAGEVGHIVVDESGPRCGCGNYGCLETMASTSRVVERTKRLIRQGAVSSLNALEDVEDISIEKIIEAARDGDEAARIVLLEAARYLGIAISSLVNTLNPSKVVIGKEFVKYADLVMEQIKTVVVNKALKLPSSNVEIVASDIGEKASTLGAAIIPLQRLFLCN